MTATTNDSPPPTFAGLRLSALLETALLLLVLLLIDLFTSGDRFWDVNPHPFWLIVLLMSCKYGTREGLLAAIASSVVLLLGNLPEQRLDQDTYAWLFMVVQTPLLWLVAAVGFGELRQMHIRERDGLKSELVASGERESTIARSYQWVKELKERLELRMAGQLKSSLGAYHAAKTMERLNTDEVLKGLEELVQSALNPEQFSIYLLTPKGLELALTQGWKEKDAYTRSFDPRHALTQAIAANSGVLCVANPDHERLLAGQAILAGALTDRESGEVLGMLKVERLGFTDLNLSVIESFAAICQWAGMAIVNARKYQTAKAESIVNPDHNLLTYSYFRRYLDFITGLAKRVGFDVSMIVIHLANAERMESETRIRVGRLLSDAVTRGLRGVDQAFEYQEHSDDYSIVLPATDKSGAEIVLERIRKDLLAQSRNLAVAADYTFSVQSIYEKP